MAHRARLTKSLIVASRVLARAIDFQSAGIAVAFKLIESAQHRRRAVNSAHLVALVRAGAKFENGVLVE